MIWHYDKADIVAVRKSIEMFRWDEHLAKMPWPNEQIKLLNEVLMNIYSNFIPNLVKAISPFHVLSIKIQNEARV